LVFTRPTFIITRAEAKSGGARDEAFAEKKRHFAENQWRALLIGRIFGIFGGKCIFKP
jgi:hypothetical protein